MNLRKYYPDALTAASHSKDTTKVGAVIIDHRGVVRATGWNGFPRGIEDHPKRYADRQVKLRLVCHAEANAIANAAAVGVPLEGCGLVVTKYPCNECAKLIIQAGITRVYTKEPERDSNWIESATFARMMFDEAGIQVEVCE